MEYTIRKATEIDKADIARTLAYSFEKDFSGLSKDMELIAKVFENGVNPERFVVAQLRGKVVGIVGIGDNTGRSISTTKKECRKHLGFVRGFFAFLVFTEEFIKPLDYPVTTGVIDVLGVLEEARGKGIAGGLLLKAIELFPKYTDFDLNVTDVNDVAQKLYKKTGFVEYKRVPYKYAKQAGFNEKIYMRYERSENA